MLRSKRLSAPDEYSALDQFHARGWTDGLPVVIPTPERVELMLTTGGQDPDLILGTLGPADGDATVEKVAVNAVMAGCLPEYFPVVLAAVRAVAAPDFRLAAVASTTHAAGPVIIVNGPARGACGPIASGWGALGPGHRANASIGRALSLTLINIGGARPGVSDMAILGQPGKFTSCFAEAEEESPFPPLHSSFGFDADQSAVTVVALDSPHSVVAALDGDDPDGAEKLLRVLAASIANAGSNNTYGAAGSILVLLNPMHAGVLAGAGMTRADVQHRLAELASTPPHSLRRFSGLVPRAFEAWQEPVSAVQAPGDILIAVAGGPGIYSAVFDGWISGHGGPVVKEIELNFACELPGLTTPA